MTTTPELDAAIRASCCFKSTCRIRDGQCVKALCPSEFTAIKATLRSLRRPTSATFGVVRQAVEDVLNAMIEPGATTTLWELSDKAASAALTAYWPPHHFSSPAINRPTRPLNSHGGRTVAMPRGPLTFRQRDVRTDG